MPDTPPTVARRNRVRTIQARIREIHAAIEPGAAGVRELQHERYQLRRELRALDPDADLIPRDPEPAPDLAPGADVELTG